MKSKASFPLKGGKGETGGDCLRAGTEMTQAQSRTQQTPGLPPKICLSPYQTKITTSLWRICIKQTNPKNLRCDSVWKTLKIYVWFLMYRNYHLIQTLRAGSAGVPGVSRGSVHLPRCPCQQAGRFLRRGKSYPCLDLRSDCRAGAAGRQGLFLPL